MDDSTRSAAPVSPADSLAARLRRDWPERERAAMLQLMHELRDELPYDAPPQLRDVSVLMADLRGFSALAAGCDPATLVALVQPFFVRMTEVIHEHGGFVDKFLGDGVMALFGAPEPREDHVLSALRCAARMQRAMDALNRDGAALKLPPLYAGIGVNSGEVMTGSFGCDGYREYTVLGAAVNLAARMEKVALRGEVLLSERCFLIAGDSIEIASTRQLHPRGHSGPMSFYALGAVTAPQRIDVPSVEVRASPRVPVDLPLRYRVVEDQRVLPQEHEGRILNIGYGGMLAELQSPLPDMGEISFGLAAEPTAPAYEDVYARALHRRDHERGGTAFAFTSLGSRGSEAVRRYVDQTLLGS